MKILAANFKMNLTLNEINEYIEVPKELVNKTKEDLQNYYKDYEIKSFDETQLTLP